MQFTLLLLSRPSFHTEQQKTCVCPLLLEQSINPECIKSDEVCVGLSKTIFHTNSLLGSPEEI